MTEIRPIRLDEGDTFLELMCSVFDLDFARAHDVFFSEPLFDLNRKWALFEEGEMVSILTTTALRFGWGDAIGIAGVATHRGRQGLGCASRLLTYVLDHSEAIGEPVAMLFARDNRVYERLGFESLDEVVRGELAVLTEPDGPMLETEDVAVIYDAWASAHPDRLRRDARRWGYWRWNYRIPTGFGDGYICHEPSTLRETLFTPPVDRMPLPLGTEWFGTRLVADQLQLPLTNPRRELTLMCRRSPGIPQLFMTDQF
jgi:GNAT superfamily N-acetyltransferase